MTRPAKQPVCRTYSKRFDLFSLVQTNTRRYPFLLESTARQEKQQIDTARYDILLCHPQQTLQKNADNTLALNGADYPGEAFLPTLDQLWREQGHTANNLPNLPFSGGWFLYLGYELAAEIEPTLQLPNSDGRLPIAQATRIPAAIIYDHARDQTTIVVEAAYAALLDDIEHDLLSLAVLPEMLQSSLCTALVEDVPQTYLDNTRKVLDYIREGDVFQVNLSRQWQGKAVREVVQFPLYQRLRRCNPAPFAGFAALVPLKL